MATHEIIKAGEFSAPAVFKTAFHCPHCGVASPQTWSRLRFGPPHLPLKEAQRSFVARGECNNCGGQTYWFTDDAVTDEYPQARARMIYPEGGQHAPLPHQDMPDDVRADYEEARAIVARSPRGAAALLRLALQKLMPALGEKGKKLDDDIAALVKKGLPVQIQQALDSLRVIGNNAVHPGELDLSDDSQVAGSLFTLLNFIVEQMIRQPKELAALYATLPGGAVAAIERRDADSRQAEQP